MTLFKINVKMPPSKIVTLPNVLPASQIIYLMIITNAKTAAHSFQTAKVATAKQTALHVFKDITFLTMVRVCPVGKDTL